MEISQNTEKSPGDLRRLVVTQTPVKNHQLTLVWKTLKSEQINIDRNTEKSPGNFLSDYSEKPSANAGVKKLLKE